jgi:hypothetical protein
MKKTKTKPTVKTPPPKPPRQETVQGGFELGWDLTGVDSSYLVAELIRRGHYPVKPPATPPAKKGRR